MKYNVMPLMTKETAVENFMVTNSLEKLVSISIPETQAMTSARPPRETTIEMILIALSLSRSSLRKALLYKETAFPGLCQIGVVTEQKSTR